MNKYFYGKKLNKRQKWILLGLFSIGFVIIPLLFVENVVLWEILPTVGVWPVCGILLLLMDQGPAFWYWWVSFGFGHEVEPSTPGLDYDELTKWIKDNTKGPVVELVPCEKYIFLRKRDALAFKLRW